MIEVYKMLNGLDKVDIEKLFVSDVNGGRGHSFKLGFKVGGPNNR